MFQVCRVVAQMGQYFITGVGTISCDTRFAVCGNVTDIKPVRSQSGNKPTHSLLAVSEGGKMC